MDYSQWVNGNPTKRYVSNPTPHGHCIALFGIYLLYNCSRKLYRTAECKSHGRNSDTTWKGSFNEAVRADMQHVFRLPSVRTTRDPFMLWCLQRSSDSGRRSGSWRSCKCVLQTQVYVIRLNNYWMLSHAIDHAFDQPHHVILESQIDWIIAWDNNQYLYYYNLYCNFEN